MTTVVLIIDVQNAFYDGVHLPPIAHASETLAQQVAVATAARAAAVPLLFIRHNEAGSEFDPGTPSWELHPALDVRASDIVIDKTRPDSFHDTELADHLDRIGADHLVIAGNQTEYCVNATARAALTKGYRVSVVADAHGTFDGDQPAADIIAAQNRDHADLGIAVVALADLNL